MWRNKYEGFFVILSVQFYFLGKNTHSALRYDQKEVWDSGMDKVYNNPFLFFLDGAFISASRDKKTGSLTAKTF